MRIQGRFLLLFLTSILLSSTLTLSAGDDTFSDADESVDSQQAEGAGEEAAFDLSELPPLIPISRFERIGSMPREPMTAESQAQYLQPDPTICKICFRKFPSVSKNQRHQVKHTKEKPFACTICPSRFSQNVSLNVHMRTQHNGDHSNRRRRRKVAIAEQPEPAATAAMPIMAPAPTPAPISQAQYLQPDPTICEICFRRFPSVSKNQRHQVTHTKEKPFACTLCSSRFSQNASLNDHMRRQHNGDHSNMRKRREAAIAEQPEPAATAAMPIMAPAPVPGATRSEHS